MLKKVINIGIKQSQFIYRNNKFNFSEVKVEAPKEIKFVDDAILAQKNSPLQRVFDFNEQNHIKKFIGYEKIIQQEGQVTLYPQADFDPKNWNYLKQFQKNDSQGQIELQVNNPRIQSKKDGLTYEQFLEQTKAYKINLQGINYLHTISDYYHFIDQTAEFVAFEYEILAHQQKDQNQIIYNWSPYSVLSVLIGLSPEEFYKYFSEIQLLKNKDQISMEPGVIFTILKKDNTFNTGILNNAKKIINLDLGLEKNREQATKLLIEKYSNDSNFEKNLKVNEQAQQLVSFENRKRIKNQFNDGILSAIKNNQLIQLFSGIKQSAETKKQNEIEKQDNLTNEQSSSQQTQTSKTENKTNPIVASPTVFDQQKIEEFFQEATQIYQIKINYHIYTQREIKKRISQFESLIQGKQLNELEKVVFLATGFTNLPRSMMKELIDKRFLERIVSFFQIMKKKIKYFKTFVMIVFVSLLLLLDNILSRGTYRPLYRRRIQDEIQKKKQTLKEKIQSIRDKKASEYSSQNKLSTLKQDKIVNQQKIENISQIPQENKKISTLEKYEKEKEKEKIHFGGGNSNSISQEQLNSKTGVTATDTLDKKSTVTKQSFKQRIFGMTDKVKTAFSTNSSSNSTSESPKSGTFGKARSSSG